MHNRTQKLHIFAVLELPPQGLIARMYYNYYITNFGFDDLTVAALTLPITIIQQVSKIAMIQCNV